jgi:hypothetical protein
LTKIDYKYGFPLFTRNSYPINISSDKIIISDIWSFWDYLIKKKNKDKAFLFSLLHQARNFYEVAEKSEMKSKPLLYYYSFLNFSKILIHLEQNNPISQNYNHGIGEKNNHSFSNVTIDIHKSNTPHHPNNKSIAYELLSIFGDDTSQFSTNTNKITINLKNFFSHCVGVHRAYSQIYIQKEHFHKLKEEKIYKDGLNMFFKATVQCSSTERQSLISRGYSIDPNNIITWNITRNSYNVTANDYYTLSQEVKNSGIWYFIGNQGYTLYISSNQNYRYSPEIIIYNMMFYLGSITRYHPYLFDKIFSDKEQWLMSEFLTTQPKQYIYLATAKYLGQDVMKAYSSF